MDIICAYGSVSKLLSPMPLMLCVLGWRREGEAKAPGALGTCYIGLAKKFILGFSCNMLWKNLNEFWPAFQFHVWFTVDPNIPFLECGK